MFAQSFGALPLPLRLLESKLSFTSLIYFSPGSMICCFYTVNFMKSKRRNSGCTVVCTDFAAVSAPERACCYDGRLRCSKYQSVHARATMEDFVFTWLFFPLRKGQSWKVYDYWKSWDTFRFFLTSMWFKLFVVFNACYCIFYFFLFDFVWLFIISSPSFSWA